MKAFSLHLSRLYSLAKATLAFVGLAAVFAVLLLPSERHLLRNTLPGLSAEAAEDASAGSSAEPAAAAEGIQAREQRALAEFIAKRGRIAETYRRAWADEITKL